MLLQTVKKKKSVAIVGHVPKMATPTGKFHGKLCARNEGTSARFAVKFCRGGVQEGGIGPSGNRRAGLFPLLQRVGFLDTLQRQNFLPLFVLE
ncbi:hypothetical protein [uncultured Gemmiger sp.]|uniref:hypothetical protein n=1 Tax=uncultured Gemmiger sp. TaxID=1623490 RepID=UPI00266640F1|nr:hypothetical protein [uncultured Gemmiger sp.]